MFISNAKSTFSFASMLTACLRATSIVVPLLLVAVCTASARDLVDGDAAVVAVVFLSTDIRDFGEAVAPFDFIDTWRAGVALFALLGVNGTFDMLLIPSFLLRFWTLSKHFYGFYKGNL